MGCVGTLANCLDPYTFSDPIENSAALFGGEYRREGIPTHKHFIQTFGATGKEKETLFLVNSHPHVPRQAWNERKES
jgi:hypothetical protein